MKIFFPHGGKKATKNLLPDMVEYVPQLSLEDIFRDYCRGVLHPELSRPAGYDSEDDFENETYLDDTIPFTAEDLSDMDELQVEADLRAQNAARAAGSPESGVSASADKKANGKPRSETATGLSVENEVKLSEAPEK